MLAFLTHSTPQAQLPPRHGSQCLPLLRHSCARLAATNAVTSRAQDGQIYLHTHIHTYIYVCVYIYMYISYVTLEFIHLPAQWSASRLRPLRLLARHMALPGLSGWPGIPASKSASSYARARTGQDSLHWIPSLRYSAGLTRLLHLLHVAQLLELVLTVLTSSQGVLRRMVSSRFRLQLRSFGRAWSGLGGQHARAASASRAAYLRRPLRLTQGLCSFTERRERRSSGAAAGLGRTQAQIRPQGQLIRTGALRKPRLVALPCSMCS